jgi:excisionase family DNA binding protein
MLRTEQAAKILDVTKSTLECWRCRGGGPQFVRYGRAIRYREEDLERFIESKVQRNTSENPRTP